MSRAVFVGALELQHDVARAVTLEPFVGDCRAGDIAAQVLQFLALIGAPAHRRMKSEAVEFGTQVWRGAFVWARHYVDFFLARVIRTGSRIPWARCMRSRPAAT